MALFSRDASAELPILQAACVLGFALPLVLGAAPIPVDMATWSHDPLAWQFGAKSLRYVSGTTALAVYDVSPLSKDVTVAADVRVDSDPGESWKVAAVAIVQDYSNFWHLALVESPDKAGSKHFFELTEMRDGSWLAQANLAVELDEQGEETWKTGSTYRLRISLDEEGIEGVVADTAGRKLYRKRHRFSDVAVTTGRPAVRCGGFAAEFAKLTAEWGKAVEAGPAKREFPTYHCESFVDDIRAKATGVFYTKEHDGLPWAIDPLGRGFVPLGVDHVRYRGHWCETLGYAPYGRKNDAKYADEEEWCVETLGRLKSWGFNLLTAGPSSTLFRRGLAHTRSTNIGSHMAQMGDEFDITPNEGRPCSAFPNVFHPKFEAFCRYRARQLCEPYVGDPWLFGYFLDNELAWWGRGAIDTGLFDAVMKKDRTHSAKIALRDFLRERYGADVARLNAAWGTELPSFDGILVREKLNGGNAKTADADKKAFLALIAERYFGAIVGAIRAVDPDHMILGCRFAGGRASDVVWATAGKYSDILTMNYYGSINLDTGVAMDPGLRTPLPEALAPFHEMGGKPMMITEWSFPAIDSGLPCTKGAGQRFHTQTERAEATDIFARTLLSLPFMLGFDYFMWVDEPALGISSTFPENTNYGLITEDGKPYPEITAAFTRLTREAAGIRRQGTPPAPKAALDVDPPAGPDGTNLVLWNRGSQPVPGGPLWFPLPWEERTGKRTVFEAHTGQGWRGVPAQLIRHADAADAAVVLSEGIAPGQGLFMRMRRIRALAPAARNALTFDRDGDRFEASTGAFSLKGKIGSNRFFDDVSLRGTHLGQYNGMLQLHTDRNVWTDIDRVTDFKATVGPVAMAIEVTGERRAPDGQPEEPRFSLTHRLTLFPDADWYVIELLEARNTGSVPLDVRAFFFRFYGEIGGSADGDSPMHEDRVPRLWGAPQGDAWVDVEAGAFWGAAALPDSEARVTFWLNEQGGQHPDARTPVELKLAPGEVYRPQQAVAFVALAGKRGPDAWQKALSAAGARLGIRVHLRE